MPVAGYHYPFYFHPFCNIWLFMKEGIEGLRAENPKLKTLFTLISIAYAFGSISIIYGMFVLV